MRYASFRRSVFALFGFMSACGSPEALNVSSPALQSSLAVAQVSAATPARVKLQPTPIGTPVVDASAFSRLERSAIKLETLARLKPAQPNLRLSSRFIARGAKPAAVAGTSEQFTSTEWDVERDLSVGRVFARRASSVGARPVAESLLIDAANKELDALGIDASERTLLYKQVMGQDLSADGVEEAPVLFTHKIFAFRSIEGIRVASHRIVLGFDDDKTLTRAYGRWPAIADQGHKLRTRLSTAQVQTRAKLQLEGEGIVNRATPVRFEYVPAQQTDGTVTLELTAVATYIPEDSEPRHVRVPLDAF